MGVSKSVALEDFGGFEGTHGLQPGGDEQHIALFTNHLGLAQLEGAAILVQHQWDLAAKKSHVHRAMMALDAVVQGLGGALESAVMWRSFLEWINLQTQDMPALSPG